MQTFVAPKVKLTDFEILQTLGRGSFGRVRLSKNKCTNEYVALKILKKEEILKHKQVDDIISENTILSVINHPFLIRMLGFTQDKLYLYFILEYIQGGELFKYLRGKTKFSIEETVFYISQVICMFEYLHSQNIIYRDLKPENILINSDGYLKLTDFGFAKFLEDGTKTYTLCGTPEYMAPEIILNKGHGKEADWWTVGILLFEMISGNIPFSDEDPLTLYRKILNGKIKFEKTFNKEAKDLISKLVVVDPKKRWGNRKKRNVTEIKNHKFLSQMAWDLLLEKKLFAPYKPNLTSKADATNFNKYADSLEPPAEISEKNDPFINW